MIKRIHVHQHIIKANAKDGGDRPVLSVKTSKGTTTANRVEIHGPSELIYRPEKPLSCGARVWVETHAEVSLFVEDEEQILA